MSWVPTLRRSKGEPSGATAKEKPYRPVITKFLRSTSRACLPSFSRTAMTAPAPLVSKSTTDCPSRATRERIAPSGRPAFSSHLIASYALTVDDIKQKAAQTPGGSVPLPGRSTAQPRRRDTCLSTPIGFRRSGYSERHSSRRSKRC